MTATRQVRYGGRAAPPLTDESLAAYRKMIDDLPDSSPFKGALDGLWKCCKAWWELPEPEGTEKGLHPNGIFPTVAMHDDHKKALWDLIPWDHELDALCGASDGKEGLLDTIDSDINHRNGEKRRAWNLAVIAHIIEQFYPGDPTAYDKIWQAINSEDKWLPFVSDDEKAKHAERKQRAQECCNAITQALTTKKYGRIPDPVFEPTPLRHCATHLIWHVRELNLDREPITTDKLR